MKRLTIVIILLTLLGVTLAWGADPGRGYTGNFRNKGISGQDVTAHGAVADGSTDDHVAFEKAITAAASVGGIVIVPKVGANAYKIEDDVTVPVGVKIYFEEGAFLSVDTTKTFTINGTLEAGLYKIMSGAGTLVLGTGSCAAILPQWWGAVGDGSNDDTDAIQYAIDAVDTAGGGTILFVAGTYKITGVTLTTTGFANITFRGVGSGASIISVITAGNAIGFDIVPSKVNFEALAVISTGNLSDGNSTIGIRFSTGGNAVNDTTIAFVDSNPDTITDSNNGLADFTAGETLTVYNSASNDGTYTIASAVAGTITLIGGDTLNAEGAGASVFLYEGGDSCGYNHLFDVKVEGFSDSGIYWDHVHWALLDRVWLHANNYGVYFNSPYSNTNRGTTYTVANSYITSNVQGVKIKDTIDGTVANCMFELDTYGIYADGNPGVLVVRDAYFGSITTNDIYTDDAFLVFVSPVATDQGNSVNFTIVAAGNQYPMTLGWLDATVRDLYLRNLRLHDTNRSHDLVVAAGSDLSADRILTLTTGDAARTITLSGNPTLADWFGQAVKVASSPIFAGLTVRASGTNNQAIFDSDADKQIALALRSGNNNRWLLRRTASQENLGLYSYGTSNEIMIWDYATGDCTVNADFTIGDNSDNDFSITFDSDTSDGIINYDEDNADFEFDQDAIIQGNLVSNTYNFALDTAVDDDYLIALSPIPDGYVQGMPIMFIAVTANTGACTVDVNTLGAKPLKKLHDEDPPDNYIEAGSVVFAVYDGTNFQMFNDNANP